MATRRLHNTIADHGARYLERQGNQTIALIAQLLQQDILQAWQEGSYQFTEASGLQPLPAPDRYVATAGMSSIAKTLAVGLDVRLNHRVTQINPTEEGWELLIDPTSINIPPILTRALVLAVPAPQALELLLPLADQGLSQDYLEQLATVVYDPCITVMAGYTSETLGGTITPPWQTVTFPQDPDLAWIGLDSSKRISPSQPALEFTPEFTPQPRQTVVVIHSTPNFAANHLTANHLDPVGQQLLDRAAHHLFPELKTPLWFQTHRWRYAQPQTSLAAPYLAAPTSAPLVCCGDWCGDDLAESALVSGLAAAQFLLP
jgi:predicted NAD/FAD-dependent oxidoreductase